MNHAACTHLRKISYCAFDSMHTDRRARQIGLEFHGKSGDLIANQIQPNVNNANGHVYRRYKSAKKGKFRNIARG